MAKVLIEVRTGDVEEEGEIASMIARGLASRGYENITVVVKGAVYFDPIAEAFYKEAKKKAKGVDKDQPIVTVAKSTYH